MEMEKDPKSKKWQLYICSPAEMGYTHEKIKGIMKNFENCIYWCMADETSAHGIFHTHIYLRFTKGVSFSKIIKYFKGAHIDMCKGTSAWNRDYVFKEGKWKNREKGNINHQESHYESYAWKEN